MKRISALLLACLLAISAAMAQKLKITEVRQAMEPMTVPMQRLDANGDICALVKVSLPHEGVRFEGNVVGEPLFKTNEYWVYMTGGTKMVNIKAPGYYSVMVDFRQHDIGALESKAIYYIVLEPEAAQTAAAPPRVEANYAVITVEPASATVRIDGQPRQVTGGTVTALLKLGSHTYEVENTGYQAANGSFEITAADKTRLNVSLVSNMRTLSVTTDAGATISIDGAVKSRGKWQGLLLPGMYSVEIQRPGYRPWKKVVELADSDVSLQIGDTEFTPVYGTLNVDYRPVGAIVKLNGQTVGDTPLNKPDVLCGQYTLTIESPGHATYSQSVTIDESTPVNLTGQLDQQNTTIGQTSATNTPQNSYYSVPTESAGNKLNYSIIEYALNPLIWANKGSKNINDITKADLESEIQIAKSKGIFSFKKNLGGNTYLSTPLTINNIKISEITFGYFVGKYERMMIVLDDYGYKLNKGERKALLSPIIKMLKSSKGFSKIKKNDVKKMRDYLNSSFDFECYQNKEYNIRVLLQWDNNTTIIEIFKSDPYANIK